MAGCAFGAGERDERRETGAPVGAGERRLETGGRMRLWRGGVKSDGATGRWGDGAKAPVGAVTCDAFAPQALTGNE